MSSTASFREEYVSQIPALRLLMQLGFTYLAPDEALRLRGGRLSDVVLGDVLREWLAEHNVVRYKGEKHAFSEKKRLQKLALSVVTVTRRQVTVTKVFCLKSIGSS